jgi:hypothetical protein
VLGELRKTPFQSLQEEQEEFMNGRDVIVEKQAQVRVVIPQGQFLQKTNIIASNDNNRRIYKFQWVPNLQSRGSLGLYLSKVCQL